MAWGLGHLAKLPKWRVIKTDKHRHPQSQPCYMNKQPRATSSSPHGDSAGIGGRENLLAIASAHRWSQEH